MLIALSMYASVAEYIKQSKLNRENVKMSEMISDQMSINESMSTTTFRSFDVEMHGLMDNELSENSNICAFLFG